jgi:hypothetical protein
MAISALRGLKLAGTAALGLLLGGCYYGDVYGASSQAYGYGEDCYARYGDGYWDYDPTIYDDGYGYDCYDRDDYRGGFVQIGFYGGWYDNYYYPGHGFYVFDQFGRPFPMNRHYLNYWGGRRAYWKHHGDRDWRRDHRYGDGHHGDGRRDGRRGDRNRDGNHGTPPVGGVPGTHNPGSDGNGGWGGPGIRRGRPDGDTWQAGRTTGNEGDRRPPRGERPAPTGNGGPVVAPVIQEIPAPSPMPQAGRPGRGDGRASRRDTFDPAAVVPPEARGGRRDRGDWGGNARQAPPPVMAAPPPPQPERASRGLDPASAPAARAPRGPEVRQAPPAARSEPSARSAPAPRAAPPPRAESPSPRVQRFETRGGDSPGGD